MKEQLRLRDFLTYQFLSDVRCSDDGKHVAYVRSICDEKQNSYRRYLHIHTEGKDLQLTTFGKEGLFLWDDEETILFANVREEEDKEALEAGEERTVFYRIGIHGGEAYKAFSIPLTVLSLEKIKKGLYIVLADYDLRYSSMYEKTEEEKGRLLKEKKEMQDYEVLDELPFYGNGVGYTNKKRHALFLYEEEKAALHRISPLYFDVCDVVCDALGRVYYAGEEVPTKYTYKESIRCYDVQKASDEELLPQGDFSISKLEIWGEHLLVLASEQSVYGVNENRKFYLLDRHEHRLQLFADNEEAFGSSVGSDCRYGGGAFCRLEEERFYFITTRRNASEVFCLDKEGTVSAVTVFGGSIDALDVKNGQIFFIGMQKGKLQELYSCDRNGEELQQLTYHNEEILLNKDIRPYERIQFERDGEVLDGWVLTPAGYDEHKRYPAILDIHGGPKTVYGEVFYHEMQVWANMGYIVCFMNPRGSDGRGNAFADIRGKYGTGDYEDLMMFVDEVIRRYPVDPKRFGVTGGSYGGFMTNWIITHTDRFCAAASQRSIANWVSFAHTSDIGEMFAGDQQAGDTWKNVEKLWWHSPLKYADRCKTPTLFIHSDEDYRCPYSEGLQMYSALAEHGVETRLVMFKGENHELSRSGKPRHRVKRLEEITTWMEKHLKS